jgi:hypothetical protein
MIPVRVSATLSETTGIFGREPDNIVHMMFMKSVVARSLRFVQSEPGTPAVRSCKRLGLARCECKAYPPASGDREHVLEFMEDSTMAVTKQASKRKRRKEVVPALGVVGVSLSLASGASAATAGSVTDMPSKDTATGPGFALSEEEISDVSLGTFFVFDKENAGASRLGEQVARGCGRGCGGCRGCRGCRGCARGCGGGCGGCGGCGCCLSWGSCRIC